MRLICSAGGFDGLAAIGRRCGAFFGVFGRRLTALELIYALGVWARTLVRKAERDDEEPVTAADLAKRLPKRAWRTIGWRDGTNARLASRFARVRMCAAGEGTTSEEPEEWLIVEWPKGEKEPTKFWLSTLPADISFEISS